MQLTQEPAEGYFFVRACRPDAITIVDRELTKSFIVAPDRVVEDWPVTNASEFDVAAADAIAALEPEVVLLGTGERQVFPSREIAATLPRISLCRWFSKLSIWDKASPLVRNLGAFPLIAGTRPTMR